MALSERLKNGNKVCVIGAGTMGSGIAAHLANIGFQVTLLDVTDESVRTCFDRAKAARPPHFYIRQTADTIRLGSIEKNLDWVSEADWVCEAVVEKLDIKKSLFAKIEGIIPSDSLISTNTSGRSLTRYSKAMELMSEIRRSASARHSLESAMRRLRRKR